MGTILTHRWWGGNLNDPTFKSSNAREGCPGGDVRTSNLSVHKMQRVPFLSYWYVQRGWTYGGASQYKTLYNP